MEKPSALIIEDDRDIAALFRQVLDLAGFQTSLVWHGQAALERLRQSQPDLVLLDLHLPGVPGGKILAALRAEPRLVQTKVVIVTGHAEAVGSLPAEPDLVLLKPFSLEQLSALVKRIVLSARAPQRAPLTQPAYDTVTGLYNQSFFRNRLESCLQQARELEDYLFALFLFKLEPAISEQGAGTQNWQTVQSEVAALLRGILRPTDTLARFDKDTFFILIENVPGGEIATRIANRIQQILAERIPNLEAHIRLPIRVGMLLCGQGYENADVILNDARYALVLASAQGDEYSNYYYQVSPRKP